MADDRYIAHAAGAGHAHRVQAASLVDAALVFAERHAALADDDALRVIVQAEDGGPEHCFVVHLDDGQVEGCA